HLAGITANPHQNRMVRTHPAGTPWTDHRSDQDRAVLKRAVRHTGSPSPGSSGLPGSHSSPPGGPRENPIASGAPAGEHRTNNLSGPSDSSNPSDHHPAFRITDDLASLNPDAGTVMRQWAPLPREAWRGIEARVRGAVLVRDDFVRIPFPRLAAA